jgi:hypothetical protein
VYSKEHLWLPTAPQAYSKLVEDFPISTHKLLENLHHWVQGMVRSPSCRLCHWGVCMPYPIAW